MPGNRINLKFTLNQRQVSLQAPPDRRLIDILHYDFGLTGTREGCGRGECGSCLVLMNGIMVSSCLIPAFKLGEAEIITVEGLSQIRGVAGFLTRFEANQPFLCGHCSSGVKVALAALFLQNPNPEEEEVSEVLSGNLCLCSAYPGILAAAQQALKASKRRRHVRR